MKSLLLVLAVSFFSQAHAATVAQYPELEEMIELMQHKAPDVEREFEYSEVVPKGGCSGVRQDLSAEQVVARFTDYMDTLNLYSEEDDLVKNATEQFRELIGEGPFTVCSVVTTDEFYVNQVEVYKSPSYSFSVYQSSEN